VFKFFRRKKEEEIQPQEEVVARTNEGLEKASGGGGIFGSISKLFEVDDITDDFWEELEALLIQADLGFDLTQKLIENSQRRTLDENTKRRKDVERIFRQEMISSLTEVQQRAQQHVVQRDEQVEVQRQRELERIERDYQRQVEKYEKDLKKGKVKSAPPAMPPALAQLKQRSAAATAVVDGEKRPYIIMMIGVNGTGKTTSIAKLSHFYKSQGANVVLGAGDTFRAGAIHQLKIWGERVGVPVIARNEGSDPSAVAFDTVRYANENSADIAIIDTAGRIQTNFGLMEEMKKIERVVEKAQTGAPHEILLTLEAVTGQNGLSQAKNFADAVGVDGIILTKLDGTAKGGIAFAIAHELKIPVKYIGTGEKMTDFAIFNPEAYVNALFRRQ
jgi:fused signal recognition particle receptor